MLVQAAAAAVVCLFPCFIATKVVRPKNQKKKQAVLSTHLLQCKTQRFVYFLDLTKGHNPNATGYHGGRGRAGRGEGYMPLDYHGVRGRVGKGEGYDSP